MRPRTVVVGEAEKSTRRNGDATEIFVSQTTALYTNFENLPPQLIWQFSHFQIQGDGKEQSQKTLEPRLGEFIGAISITKNYPLSFSPFYFIKLLPF